MHDDKTPQAGWVFSPGGKGPAEPETTRSEPEESSVSNPVSRSASGTAPEGARVSWSASEYIANPKNFGWFGLLGVGSIVFAAVVYLLTQDVVAAIVIIVLALMVGVFATRQPQVLEYHIGEEGLHIGQKFYPYPGFKSFSVVEEGAFAYISLMPLKRFMPPLSIHFSPDDEEKIINTLADYLPYEEYKHDVVESLSRRLRF